MGKIFKDNTMNGTQITRIKQDSHGFFLTIIRVIRVLLLAISKQKISEINIFYFCISCQKQDTDTLEVALQFAGDNGHCNMAEVRFFSDDGSRLCGKVIGTEGSYQNNNNNRKEAVFDGDPLTFYDALESSGAWSGLDLGTPRSIRKINYVFRNDDNNIRIGDDYKLFYWNNGWCSPGRLIARGYWSLRMHLVEHYYGYITIREEKKNVHSTTTTTTTTTTTAQRTGIDCLKQNKTQTLALRIVPVNELIKCSESILAFGTLCLLSNLYRIY